MEIYKIIAVGLVSAVIVVYLKSVNSELSMLAAIAAGVVILIMSVSYVVEFISVLSGFTEKTNIDGAVFGIVLKIIAISYFVEFSASLIEDFGLKNISDKVVFAGKLLILSVSFPIVKNLIEVIGSLL